MVVVVVVVVVVAVGVVIEQLLWRDDSVGNGGRW